jgi:lysophospholipase L1-like esterase
MKKSVLLLLAVVGVAAAVHAQKSGQMVWWNPADSKVPVIEGQAWPAEVTGRYDRLPSRAEKTVRPDVWNLSRNAAGLVIRFRSDAAKISVRYAVGGPVSMHHMPSTGVSGVDLYAKNADGAWLWSAARYSFGDTVRFDFNGINPAEANHRQGREYRLYLPLYNSVKWLQIGVPDTANIEQLPVRMEKPIVVYGTSIGQGACASRPGMAWTAILGRSFDLPLVNLAFSGNGRLEKELISLMTEIDAEVYVLDCLPNLVSAKNYPAEEVIRRIMTSVKELRSKRPEVPVLLTDHAGYTDGLINPVRQKDYIYANEAQHVAFARLKSDGLTGIYLLTCDEIGLTLDAMVDGTHPSDLGMQQYAVAYEARLREILHQPIGRSTAAKPCTQAREPGTYDWEARHRTLLEMNMENPPGTVFIGNSITHYWAGEPSHPLHRGEDSWKKILDPVDARNFGFGWDRVENVIWRVYHGELDGYTADRVIINIGTNNLHLNSDAEILEGMELLLRAVRQRQPTADILLLGLYPRRQQEVRVARINLEYARLAGKLNVRYADVGQDLLLPDNKIDESMFTDGLHPNGEGYRKIAERLALQLK